MRGFLSATLVGLVLAYGCGEAYSEAPPGSADGGTSARTDGGGSSSSSSSSGSPNTTVTEAPAGQIRCATTAKTCSVGPEQCCVTLTGSAGVVRRADDPSATCMAKGGPNCAVLTQTGDDFMQKIPQTCARASDCGDGESCCALPLSFDPTPDAGGDRFGKTIGEIVCRPIEDCRTRGRILCRTKEDCPTTTDCTAETDPILSKLYSAFCF